MRATLAYHKVWARTTVNQPGSFELVIKPFKGPSMGEMSHARVWSVQDLDSHFVLRVLWFSLSYDFITMQHGEF